MSDQDLELQKMLTSQLRRDVEVLQKEHDRLVAALHQLAEESVSRVYVLEEERDEARRERDSLEEQLEALAGSLVEARARIRDLEAGKKIVDLP